jgi:hypothetical protein
VVLLSVVVISCGGGGSSGSTTGGSSTDTTDNSDTSPGNVAPDIAGFDFILNEGDFWEYQWDYSSSSAYSGGGSSGDRNGIFRITLGKPSTVGGMTVYPLIVSGNNRQDVDGASSFISPRWTHLAVYDNQIMVSSDGSSFETVFDANNGLVMGFGFFEELSATNLFEIANGTVNNNYISGDAYVVSDSASESNCEYFPGYGTICGADVSVDYTMMRREYYQEGVGPVGYYYHYSASTGGTFDSVHVSKTVNIGLIASSLRGDIVDYTLETEFNNTPQTASPVSYSSLPVTLRGDFNYQADIDISLPENFATNHYLYLNGRNETEPNNSLAGSEAITLNTTVHGNASSSDTGEFRSFTIPGYTLNTSIEDWYHYSMSEARPFDALLEFYGAADGVDIDLWLFDGNGEILDYSFGDNSAADGSDDSEHIRADLVPGDYYIGVDIWPDTNNGPAKSASYRLSLNQSSFGSDPAVSNQVAIVDFYRINVENTGALTITANPSMGLFLTDPSGETVLASAPETVDTLATQTVLATPVMTPGEYLIAVGAQSYHWASMNNGVDTYEITVAGP